MSPPPLSTEDNLHSCFQLELTGENVRLEFDEFLAQFFSGLAKLAELMIILEQMCEGGHPAKTIMLMGVQTLSQHNKAGRGRCRGILQKLSC